MMSTQVTWEAIRDKKCDDNAVRRTFTYPWILICALTTFIFKTIYADEKGLETGFLLFVVSMVSFLGAFFVTRKIAFSLLNKEGQHSFEKEKEEKLVAYSFAVIYVIDVVTNIIPSLFFLKILNVYSAYIVWEGSHILLGMNDDERGRFVLIIGISVIFLPGILSGIIHLMLPVL